MSGTDLGNPPEPAGQGWEPRQEIEAVTESSGSDPNWQKLFLRYLQLGEILDDEAKTHRLACQTKRFLIHDDELYHHSISGILPQCIPIMEGKVLLLDIHEEICGHHAS
jgi:hypothetical protein